MIYYGKRFQRFPNISGKAFWLFREITWRNILAK